MEITLEERQTEKELAMIVNDLESLQLKIFSTKIYDSMNQAVNNFYNITLKHEETIKKYWDEILDILKGVNEWYAKIGHEPAFALEDY